MGKKEVTEDSCQNCGKSLKLHTAEELYACEQEWLDGIEEANDQAREAHHAGERAR